MNKKNNLAFLMLFIVAFLSLFSINVSAQNKVVSTDNQPTKTCSGEKFVMPSTIADGNTAFETYLKVASLQMTERKDAFRKLSDNEKATFIKVNLALQFVKRPNMTDVQRQFVLDSMSKVSADLFDKSDAEKVRLSEQTAVEIVNKAFGLFPKQEGGDFIEPLNTDKNEEIIFLRNYENLLKNGMQMRKQSVKQMSMSDRVNIWKTQLAYHLATSTLDYKQKDFLISMMPRIQSILEASSELPKDQQVKYLDNLEAELFKVFTKMETFAIFMEIGIQKVIDDNNLLPADCNCRWYCSGSGQSCNNADRRVVSYCGPFDTWDCTTRCHIS